MNIWSTVGFGLVAAGLGACTESQPPECSDVHNAACTWAGVKNQRGSTADGLDRTASWLAFPSDLTFAPDGRPWIVDWNNHRLLRVNTDRTVETMVGTNYEGDGPDDQSDILPTGNPTGAPGTTVALNHPTDVQFKPDGSAVIASWHNNKIRTWDAATGMVKVLAGDSYGFSGDGGPAYAAVFNVPKSIVIDPDGNIYVLDQRNERVRKISADGSMINTIAGAPGSPVMSAYSGDGGPAIDAQFGFELGTTPIPDGALALRGDQLFISDGLNNRIRQLDLTTGQITCIAGNGTAGWSGDGGQAIDAAFNNPLDLEFGPDGRLYVADSLNNVIRAIDLTTGIVDHVAGTGGACPALFNCFEASEGLDAMDVQFASPYGLTFDPQGNLYVSDTNNSRIVRIAK